MTQAADEKILFQRTWHELRNLERLEVDREKYTDVYGKFICQPLERGFAATIGNRLRRILLSSIQGVAITSVKIEGALHEFTPMKDIMEDVSEIILNLKQVRIKLHSPDSQKVSIEKTGPGVVTAGDIVQSGYVEVMNKDQVICTLTGEMSFHAEMTVEWGKGYQPAEKMDKENLSIGQIPIDAIFTPVKKIQYSTSQVRVGQQTDYDKLIIEIETDGSLRPEDALAYAAKILKEQLTILINFDEEDSENAVLDNYYKDFEPLNPYLNKPVEDLELSVRSAKCLKSAAINYIGDLVQKTDQEMLKIKNFDRKSLSEIKALLSKIDLTLGMTLMLPKPWVQVSEKYPIGSNIEVTIDFINGFGLFFQIEEGVKGYISISDLPLKNAVAFQAGIYEKGARIQAIVFKFDQDNALFHCKLQRLYLQNFMIEIEEILIEHIPHAAFDLLKSKSLLEKVDTHFILLSIDCKGEISVDNLELFFERIAKNTLELKWNHSKTDNVKQISCPTCIYLDSYSLRSFGVVHNVSDRSFNLAMDKLDLIDPNDINLAFVKGNIVTGYSLRTLIFGISI